MNTKCSFCGHKQLQSTQTQYIYKHDDKLLIVNDVPCQQCGRSRCAGGVSRLPKAFLSES